MANWRIATACAAPALLAAWAITATGPAAAQREAPAAAQPRAADEAEPDADTEAAADGLADLDTRLPGDFGLVPPDTERAPEDALRPTIDPYEPLGIRMGGFLLFPQIETGTIHSDNVFLTATDRRSDTALFYAPRLHLRSNWSRHELSGEASALRSHYARFSSEDDRAHDLALRGRLDVTRRTQIEAEASHGLAQESRDRLDFSAGAGARADITSRTAALQGSHRFNRLMLRLRGRIADETYSHAALPDGVVIDESDRDNVIHASTGRASYEFQPGVSAFAEAGVNQRRFRRRFDERSISRGSSGWMAHGGLAFRLTGKLDGEASAGYLRQTPDDPARPDIEGPIFNAALTWRPSALTAVRLSAASELDETSLVDTSGSLLRTYRLAVEHALRRNILLGAAIAYRTETFAEAREAVRQWEGRLEAEYLLNRNLALRGDYTYRREFATALNEGFEENRVRLGVALRH